MRRVVSTYKVTDVDKLIERVTTVGKRLTTAQPREIAVGNIVRRILGVIRMEAGEDRDGRTSSYSGTNTNSDSRPMTPASPSSRHAISFLRGSQELRSQDARDRSVPLPGTTLPFQRPPLLTSHTSFAVANATQPATSMFSLLSHAVSTTVSPAESPGPGTQSPASRSSKLTKSALAPLDNRDLRAEVVEGIDEIIDELDVVDDQIAGYALEHIHSNEIILTYGSSTTVQRFLLKAAAKRKFTVVHAEAYPNNHRETHAAITGKHGIMEGGDGEDDVGAEAFAKPLTQAGITVVLITDSAIFALMSRVNKVILGTHVVLANGGLVAAAGAKFIAQAASVHKTPVVVLSGVYKLSPTYPFDFDALIEHGDAGNVLDFADGDLMAKVDVENPLYDYVPAELIDLYITNL